MNKIRIEELEIFAFHGASEEERNLGQKFLVSAQLEFEYSGTDALEQTINYGEVCDKICSIMNKHKFNLIETCADNLAKELLRDYLLLQHAHIEVKKPWAPIGKSLKYVSSEASRGWHDVFIALGSNLGDCQKNVDLALDLMQNCDNKLVKVASRYETTPISDIPQSNYLNSAVWMKTLLEPHVLMDFLLSIEAQLHRERKERWGPRTIDLDMLFYDQKVIDKPRLTVPHPRMHERLFVLVPLCELAPTWRHPILNKTVFELRDELEKTQTLLEV